LRRQLDHGGPVKLHPGPGGMYVRGGDLLPTGELVDRPDGPYGDCFEVVGGEIGFR
jgi:hypothetical protein